MRLEEVLGDLAAQISDEQGRLQTVEKNNFELINTFLLQMLELAMITSEINQFNPDGDSDPFQSFFILQLGDQSEITYSISFDIIQKKILEQIGINRVPLLLNEPSIQENLQSLRFSSQILQEIQLKLWDNYHYSLKENIDQSNNIKKEDNEELEIITPETLGLLFEEFFNRNHRKTVQTGVFYSPQPEIDFLIQSSLWQYFQGNKHETNQVFFSERFQNKETEFKLQKLSIMDPACGTGAFLIRLLIFIHNLLDPLSQNLNIAYPLLVGMDVNSLTIELTRFRIWSFFYQSAKNLPISDRQQHLEKQMARVQLINNDFLMESINFIRRKFDLILGNPPYIRYRDLAHPTQPNQINNGKYRAEILTKTQQLPIFPEGFDRQSDYAVYFCVHALNFLKPNGVLGFIISNSWMNVKFGYSFQNFLYSQFQIRQIHDNLQKSFTHADVNTVLMVIQKPNKESDIISIAHFFRWKIPYIQALEHLWTDLDTINEMVSSEDEERINITETLNMRSCSLPQGLIKNIDQFGSSYPNAYAGFNWGNYFFNAPQFFFDLLPRIGKEIVLLQDIATIRRGITTNCNEFFILTRLSQNSFQNGYGDVFELDSDVIVPYLTTPRQIHHPFVMQSELNTVLFYTDRARNELNRDAAQNTLDYIEYGQQKEIIIKKGTDRGKTIVGVNNLASYEQRYEKDPEHWFCLKRNTRIKGSNSDWPRICIQKIYDTTCKIAFFEEPILVNNTFYEIHLKTQYKGQERLIFGMLLGSLTFLCLELYGRTNFGGGALDTATFDIGKILIPNPLNLSENSKENILSKVKIIGNQKVAPIPNTLKDKDHQKLDQILYSSLNDAFDLKDLYRSINEIQVFRIQKSNTFHK